MKRVYKMFANGFREMASDPTLALIVVPMVLLLWLSVAILLVDIALHVAGACQS